MINKRQVATILAALRLYQHYYGFANLPHEQAVDLHRIATDDESHSALTNIEIDELCEELNTLPLSEEDEPQPTDKMPEEPEKTPKQKELERTYERDRIKSECVSVSVRTTRQIAKEFSSGVDWGGSSKGPIFEAMATTRAQGYYRNWDGFKRAMMAAAIIEQRHERQIYAEVVAAIAEIKGKVPNK